MNERGHFFSEGNYDILGPPLTDGDDAITWMSSQPWSNGKVGTIGCSSTAEWQLGVAAQGNPALATMIPQGFGAGVGRVGPYYEQGNWYRGGAVQMLFIAWIYGEQNQVRPMFPPNTSQEDLIQASKMFDLAPQMPPVDWAKALAASARDGHHQGGRRPARDLRRPMAVATGGAMIKRTPERSGVVSRRPVARRHDDQRAGLLVHVLVRRLDRARTWRRITSCARPPRPEIANEQYAVIAPTLHCGYTRATENTVVGERSMGDARLDYDALTYGWFDHFLKGEDNHVLEKHAEGALLHHGDEQVADLGHLAAGGRAADDVLSFERRQSQHAERRRRAALQLPAPNADDASRRFTYDPMNPVPSYGGNVCCTGNAVPARRRVRSAQDGGAAGHPGLHVRAAEGGHRSQRPDRRDALRLVRREGHRLHREGDRRLSRRHGLQPGRDHPARCAIATDTTSRRVDGGGQGVQSGAPADDHQQLLRRRAIASASKCRAATSRASTAT